VLTIFIGENKTFVGGEEYLKRRGIEVVVLQNKECEQLMAKFITEKPGDWSVTFQMQIWADLG
jgi:creatinine deaminase